MLFAIVGTSIFVLAAVLALVLLPLPPAPAYDTPGGARWGGGRDDPSLPSLASRMRASLSARIREEYYAPSGPEAGPRKFWSNIQIMRVISVYCIAYIHMAALLAAVHASPKLVEVFRFGTDLFLVVAGFLTAQVLLTSRRGGGAYLRGRLLRLVPLYAICTVLAFLIQNFAMENHENSVTELLKSLVFISYGPFPVLYPAWTLELIVVLSLIVAAFQSLSATRGIYFAAAFIVLLVALGKAAPFEPALAFYTNPILIDFALGVFGYRIITGRGLALPRAVTVGLALVTIAVTGTVIGLRPFAWAEAPRLLALGLPVSLLVLSALILERVGVFRSSNLVNFLAKCSYCIYLTHWFVSIVSEKVIVDGHAPAGLAAIMLIVVPVVVTYLAIAVYLYVEVPVTRRLSRLLAPPRRA